MIISMEETASPLRPVAAIGPARLAIDAGAATLLMPLFTNRADWLSPDPDVIQAVIVLHGRQRNADDYLRVAVAASAGAACLIIAPQFLTMLDTETHHVDPAMLRWADSGWMGGGDAAAPAPLSGFAVLDELVARLRDKTIFPRLGKITVAGHSGGGQVAQRYALLSPHADDIRILVANPSSYAYFSADRVTDDNTSFIPDPLTYPGYDEWKYGLRHRPLYGGGLSDDALEQRYIARDIIYVLGEADCDPAHPALDRCPAAQAQGPHRLARGRRYYRYLQGRHGAALRHPLIEIPQVGHNPRGIFAADSVRAWLFGNKNTAEGSK
jgi:pimeloyl-ACP methyl ester carboxylesterase